MESVVAEGRGRAIAQEKKIESLEAEHRSYAKLDVVINALRTVNNRSKRKISALEDQIRDLSSALKAEKESTRLLVSNIMGDAETMMTEAHSLLHSTRLKEKEMKERLHVSARKCVDTERLRSARQKAMGKSQSLIILVMMSHCLIFLIYLISKGEER